MRLEQVNGSKSASYLFVKTIHSKQLIPHSLNRFVQNTDPFCNETPLCVA